MKKFFIPAKADRPSHSVVFAIMHIHKLIDLQSTCFYFPDWSEASLKTTAVTEIKGSAYSHHFKNLQKKYLCGVYAKYSRSCKKIKVFIFIHIK